jgi:hypothetical protein
MKEELENSVNLLINERIDCTIKLSINSGKYPFRTL